MIIASRILPVRMFRMCNFSKLLLLFVSLFVTGEIVITSKSDASVRLLLISLSVRLFILSLGIICITVTLLFRNTFPFPCADRPGVSDRNSSILITLNCARISSIPLAMMIKNVNLESGKRSYLSAFLHHSLIVKIRSKEE